MLGPIKTNTKVPAYCDGERAKCNLRLYSNNKKVFSEKGEVLFRKYGLSGIVVFNASRFVEEDKTQKIVLDLAPEFSEDEIVNYFKDHNITPQKATGFLSKSITKFITAQLNNKKINEQIVEFAKLTKKLEFGVKTVYNKPNSCQVCRGGLSTEKIDAKTMSIIYDSNVFVCGEMVDVDGACGGYNLNWAWLSGIVAGASAAKD